MDESDRQWLAWLAGRAPAEGATVDAHARREALALRAALQHENSLVQARVSALPDTAGQSQARLQRLLERMQQEGLLEAAPEAAPVSAPVSAPVPAPVAASARTAPARGDWAAWTGWWPPRLGWPQTAALAAVGVLAAALLLRTPPPGAPGPDVYDDLPALRSAAPPLKLVKPDPAAFAASLQEQLRQAGGAVRVYRQPGGLLVLDVDVPPEALPAAREVLERAGLPAREGLTRVEVRK
jgi:hypothetical protein